MANKSTRGIASDIVGPYRNSGTEPAHTGSHAPTRAPRCSVFIAVAKYDPITGLDRGSPEALQAQHHSPRPAGRNVTINGAFSQTMNTL